MTRAKRRGLARNAAVALGNRRDPADAPRARGRRARRSRTARPRARRVGARAVRMSASARDRLMAFRKSQPRAPRLARRTGGRRAVSRFAVFSSPEVAGAPPLLCINGGMLYSHALLWPALAPLAAGRQVILYDQRGRGASRGSARGPRFAHRVRRRRRGRHPRGARDRALGSARAFVGRRNRHARRVARRRSASAASCSWTRSGPTSGWIPVAARRTRSRGSPASSARRSPRSTRAKLHAADPAVHAEYSRAIYPGVFRRPRVLRAVPAAARGERHRRRRRRATPARGIRLASRRAPHRVANARRARRGRRDPRRGSRARSPRSCRTRARASSRTRATCRSSSVPSGSSPPCADFLDQPDAGS